jgi:hypothetical protein
MVVIAIGILTYKLETGKVEDKVFKQIIKELENEGYFRYGNQMIKGEVFRKIDKKWEESTNVRSKK